MITFTYNSLISVSPCHFRSMGILRVGSWYLALHTDTLPRQWALVNVTSCTSALPATTSQHIYTASDVAEWNLASCHFVCSFWSQSYSTWCRSNVFLRQCKRPTSKNNPTTWFVHAHSDIHQPLQLVISLICCYQNKEGRCQWLPSVYDRLFSLYICWKKGTKCMKVLHPIWSCETAKTYGGRLIKPFWLRKVQGSTTTLMELFVFI